MNTFPVPLSGTDNTLMWADEADIEHAAQQQLRNVAALPWTRGLRVMPDVHFGKGATVGSVIAMEQAIAPAAVGVDIGCGMTAVRTTLRVNQLPDDLAAIRHGIERAVPVGFSQPNGSANSSPNASRTELRSRSGPGAGGGLEDGRGGGNGFERRLLAGSSDQPHEGCCDTGGQHRSDAPQFHLAHSPHADSRPNSATYPSNHFDGALRRADGNSVTVIRHFSLARVAPRLAASRANGRTEQTTPATVQLFSDA